jgi:hypothetical protein
MPFIDVDPEAQLFSGSIRDNLDPFDQHEDYEVWEALHQCGLSGKTPAASRFASRNPSRVDLKSRSGTGTPTTALPAESLKHLQEEAFKPTVRPGMEEDDKEDEEVEERVTIRSLDERVAVGGKNFSASIFVTQVRADKSQVKGKDSF